MKKLNISLSRPSKADIGQLHEALMTLDLTVASDDLKMNKLGDSTKDAIRDFQASNALPTSGRINRKTIETLNLELFDKHHTSAKFRVSKLHDLMIKAGVRVPVADKRSQKVSSKTRKKISDFQEQHGLQKTGKIDGAFMAQLNEVAISKALETRTQRAKLHNTLVKAKDIAKIGIDISDDEIADKELGVTSKAFISEFQEKYGLEASGEINKATLDKLNSVASSKGTYMKKISAPDPAELALLTKTLRLNTVSPKVAEAQKAIAYLGYPITQKELNTQTFGKSTIKAIKQIQQQYGLPLTGHLDKDTRNFLNQKIELANPKVSQEHRYRIRGSVRDELWQRKKNMVVQIFEKTLSGKDEILLGAKKNFLNGFFDIPYDAPIDANTGKIKTDFNIRVQLFDVNDQKTILAEKTYSKVKPIHWVNFTGKLNDLGQLEYNARYLGDNSFNAAATSIQKVSGKVSVSELTETENNAQITQVSRQAGIPSDEVMRHVLAGLVADSVEDSALNNEVFYAFISQGQPSDLPGDLLVATSQWETIGQLVELASSGIVFLDAQTQAEVIKSAVELNLVSQKVLIDKDTILSSLQKQRIDFTLSKPILIGNGSLGQLLEMSSVKADHHSLVADIFTQHQGINRNFWAALEEISGTLGAKALADFQVVVELGNVSKNHLPTLEYLKSQVGSGRGKRFKRVSDLAKLDHNGFVELIGKNNGEVPENMPGDTKEDKIQNYAAAMKSRSEILYSAVSLISEVKQNAADQITEINKIEQFVDKHSDFDLRSDNVDTFLRDTNDASLSGAATEQMKVVQRAHKLTNDAKTGSLLLADGLHSSMQVYFFGKDRLTKSLVKQGVADKEIHFVYESAKMRYMQVLARLTDFRREMHRSTPGAIISQTYKTEELQKILGDIPNLEALFGSMDYCECTHCKSLYSPTAYLTDMLRFLAEHSAVDTNKSVKDVLFDRRPDIGNIELNCANTNTVLPYIDLVCEILENHIIGDSDFVYQSTLSSEELRAVPEHIQDEAYITIADADFPIKNSFNLWQSESRTYLDYLRTPRWKLMETFQNHSVPSARVPENVAIAAEYFSMSNKTLDMVVTKRSNSTSQNSYWGADVRKSVVPVQDFINRAKIRYGELLDLLMTRFINVPGATTPIEIDRPGDTCDLTLQKVTGLNNTHFDKIHRFIRLWRSTGWTMWELDLLIREPKVGNNKINEQTVINLKKFQQLQTGLNLSTEALLVFLGDINRELRIDASKPADIIQPLYNRLFQNITVTNPVDTNFQAIDTDGSLLSLDNSIELQENAGGYSPVPTILAAFALTQTDFDLLRDKTDGFLSIESLSIIYRYAYLARQLGISVMDSFSAYAVIGEDDPFTTIDSLLAFVDSVGQVATSGLSMPELDYVLNYSPESSYGLRDETIALELAVLRNTLEANQQELDQLGLSDADRADLLAFDEQVLSSSTDAQLIAAITPIVAILESAIDGFTEANFSIEQATAVVNFDTATITDTSKTELIVNLAAIKQNLSDLLESHGNQIKSLLTSSFGLNEEAVSVLGEGLLHPNTSTSLLTVLADSALIAKDADGEYTEISSANFSNYYSTFVLLHKAALLVSGMQINTENLSWFVAEHALVSTVDFASLPIAALAPTEENQYSQWRHLSEFLLFANDYPEPEDSSIREVLSLAGDDTVNQGEIFASLARLTQWDIAQVESLHDGLGLKHETGALSYLKADTFIRLGKCFAQLNLTGVDTATMFKWALKSDDLSDNKDVADEVRRAIKSKYEQDDWLDKIRSLNDEIREQKRAALVEFLIDRSHRETDPEIDNGVITNPLYWTDTNGLYKYFLIDVEMSACQLTSRLKQALSSVQLFVQRCFLNLESRYVIITESHKEDVSSANAWSQWRWMKNYRVWEANRKVFFYPENWLEPELRDDKSPFFTDLENELLQAEVTQDNVENAFENYLLKLDEVSNLEISGLYHQMDDLNPDEVGYETNVVHVIARTRSLPHIYYYRTYDMNYSRWAAWEKIDVDIEGDHVVPVVYNRKLHIFWLQFLQKPRPTKKVPAAELTGGPTDSPDPINMLEIQLGWSVKKSAGWTSKKVSEEKMIHPWERPHHSYNLKPHYSPVTNELSLDIYITTSKEFNNGWFYDPHKSRADNPVRLTSTRYNETYQPWHSSMFVFNGEVKELKLKGIGGRAVAANGDITWGDDSYDEVRDNYGEEGRSINELLPYRDHQPRLSLPNGMHFHKTHLRNNRVHNKNGTYLRVLEYNHSEVLLSRAKSPFELVITQQDLDTLTASANHPSFYQDRERSFFIKPEWEQRLDSYGRVLSRTKKYRFTPMYHPYTVMFLRELNRYGVDGLLARDVQVNPRNKLPANNFSFGSYSPSSKVIAGNIDSGEPFDRDIVDFSFGGANSIYNWELFFHAPLMIACRLMQNQKFEDAMNWFHYIFNPTNIEDYPTPQRYWVTKPFFEYNSEDYRTQRIQSILDNLDLDENADQLRAWKNDPFKPHVIARYRPVSYQKFVVMKYIDNLIAWADMLFQRDSIESINEASLLYMLAYEILGERPQSVPGVQHEDLTFNQLEEKLDAFGNARVDALVEDTLLPISSSAVSTEAEAVPKLETLYFCIPDNEALSSYWDTVEDRLFKIRNCMNIQGVVRQLPLFQPPIDPALLVKAAASGMDLSSVLNDMSAPTPAYRFRVIIEKAVAFCSDVKMLGDKLMQALERKDAEGLALLRSQHEIAILETVKGIREKQVEAAEQDTEGLQKSLEMADQRESYYNAIPYMNAWEVGGVTAHGLGVAMELAGTIVNVFGAGISMVPDLDGGANGVGGTPAVKVKFGGTNMGNAAAKTAEFLRGLSAVSHATGSLLETQGSYTRRDEENKHQAALAAVEKQQLEFMITASEVRQAIAELEVDSQELQITNAEAADDYMRDKYTNEQLYSWMVTQISNVYFQAYQLAYDMAKQAEKCFQFELGISDSNFIEFGYWDSLKKGLASGDKLMTDIRRLDAEYIKLNTREFELTKHISLAQLMPASLIELKETGQCTLSLPEWIFDMDYPGHYMRRIKNVSVSIPCIVGPHTGVNCTLSLLKNETRMESTLLGGKYDKQEDDTRFKTVYGAISSIATSNAQNDSGMFQLNFNDERYLPFEGAGAVSDWQIDLPIENNHFDFESLSDVVLHVSYTSRNGGGELATKAHESFVDKLPAQSGRLFSLKHEFSTQWHRFLFPENDNDQEFVMDLEALYLPFFLRSKFSALKITDLDVYVKTNQAIDYVANISVANAVPLQDVTIAQDAAFNNTPHFSTNFSGAPANYSGQLTLNLKQAGVTDFKSLSDNDIDDVFVLMRFSE
ncbi:MAG: neuraminidase-like domain-containing protein [Arenicella sp.]